MDDTPRAPRFGGLHWLDVLVIATAVCLGAIQIDAIDAPLHIRFGEILLDQHRMPSHSDVGAAGAADGKLNSAWLSEVLMALVYRTGGAPGVTLFFMAACALAAGCLLAALAGAGLTPGVRALLATVALALASGRITARPDALNLPALALLLLLLERALRSARPLRWLVPVPFLLALWVNLHGLWPVGAALAGATLVLLVRPRKLAAILLAASIVACFCHPQGARLLGFLATFLTTGEQGVSHIAAPIAEFRPIYDAELPRTFGLDLARWFLPCIALLFVACLLQQGRRAWDRATGLALIAILITFALAARYNRALAFAAFAGVFALGVAARPLLAARPRLERAARVAAAAGALALAWVTLSSAAYEWYHSSRRAGLEWNRRQLPVDAAITLHRLAPDARILTDYSSGSTVALFVAPEGRVFCHSLSLFFDDEVFADYGRLVTGQVTPSELADKYRLTHALIGHGNPEVGRILAALARSEDWQMLYVDSTAVIYGRGAGADVAPPSGDGLDADQLRQLGEFYVSSGDLEVARGFLERARQAGSTSGQVFCNLGVMAMRAGELEKAADAFDEGIRRDASSAALWFNRSLLRQRQGNDAGALADALEAARLDAGSAAYQLRAGQLCAGAGDNAQARLHLEHAAALSPAGSVGKTAADLLAKLPPR